MRELVSYLVSQGQRCDLGQVEGKLKDEDFLHDVQQHARKQACKPSRTHHRPPVLLPCARLSCMLTQVPRTHYLCKKGWHKLGHGKQLKKHK